MAIEIFLNVLVAILQDRVVAGTGFVGKKTGPYKTTAELWDGEL